ncbi:MAG: response regulator [Pseudomonadota bacterium]|nr:response regulator [Pseudomonadota bacterium]
MPRTDSTGNDGRYAGFKLLLVDDNANNLFALKSLIAKHVDATVLEAGSGKEAIGTALSTTGIDLIILDVQMPEMDGFQTATMLKVRKKTRDIPVIFLTAAFKTHEFQRKGYAVGAVDYLLKPIDDNLLINKISTYFRLIDKERRLNQILEEQVTRRTEELSQARQYLENVINTMGEALLVLNPGGAIKSVNPAACHMLEYKADELLGMSIGDVFEEDEDTQAGAFMGTWLEALVRSGVLGSIDARFIASDGRRVPIQLTRTAMIGPDGVITDIICIAKDMSGYVREGEDLLAEASKPR